MTCAAGHGFPLSVPLRHTSRTPLRGSGRLTNHPVSAQPFPVACRNMWYLSEVAARNGPKHWLGGTAGGGRTIGRKHVDIRLKASSVSRTHARITILKSPFYTPSHHRHSTSVSVQDSSAYGTFLKFPPGHATSRADEVEGHHRRLDKDTPTDVCENTLLAFGAPTAWWRVCWEHIAICPSRLAATERARIDAVSKATSLEVVDTWSDEVTHLVTNKCLPTSFKFLTALAYDRHIVTPAWVEAVNQIVTEACRKISEVQTDQGAVLSTRLPDEKLFFPLFSIEDLRFPLEVLTTAFDPSKRTRRKALFDRIAFAFATEEHRSKWALIITQLGGCTMLAQSARNRVDPSRFVYVKEEDTECNVDTEKPWMPDSALIEAILAADLSPLRSGLEFGGAAEFTDVATPGPLDVESEPESEDSDGAHVPDPRRTEETGRDGRPAQKATNQDVVGTKRSFPQSDFRQKRSRTQSGFNEEGQKENPVSRPEDLSEHKADASREGTDTVDIGQDRVLEIDRAAVNERAFFPLPGHCRETAANPASEDDTDVRLFRKNPPPQASIVPVKRIPVLMDMVRRGLQQKREGYDDLRGKKSRTGQSRSGAELIHSEEE